MGLAEPPNHPEALFLVPLLAGSSLAREVMPSMTAVRQERDRDRSRSPTTFPQVRAGVVGLAGLEPAPSSLSGIEG
jgi:hypothetical protein